MHDGVLDDLMPGADGDLDEADVLLSLDGAVLCDALGRLRSAASLDELRGAVADFQRALGDAGSDLHALGAPVVALAAAT